MTSTIGSLITVIEFIMLHVLFIYTPFYYLCNKFGEERKARNKTLSVLTKSDVLSSKVITARIKRNATIDLSTDLLTMAVISDIYLTLPLHFGIKTESRRHFQKNIIRFAMANDGDKSLLYYLFSLFCYTRIVSMMMDILLRSK